MPGGILLTYIVYHNSARKERDIPQENRIGQEKRGRLNRVAQLQAL